MHSLSLRNLALAATVASTVYAVPSVTPSDDALAMAKKLVGPGLTVLSATFQGGKTMSGFYSNGPLGIQDSVVLTTGEATHPDDSSGEGTDEGQPGFDKCEALSAGAGTAYDASVLTIKLKLDDGFLGLFARFVFATDEYPIYVGSKFNDVFGIWVDGTQIAHDSNGAPITINGGFFSTANVLEPPNSGTTYLGSTPLLTSGYSTTPGEHTVEIAICDISDYIRDSAVFLTLSGCEDANSCKNGTSIVTDLPPTYTPYPTGGGACKGGYGTASGVNCPTSSPTSYVKPSPTAPQPTQYTGAAASNGNGAFVGLGAFIAGLLALV